MCVIPSLKMFSYSCHPKKLVDVFRFSHFMFLLVILATPKSLCIALELQGNQSQVVNTCDIYSGSWVLDPSYPLYQSCPLLDGEFDCIKNGRHDTNYLHYKWKPNNCRISRFDGLEFMEKLRGKILMFVGDSLARNQYQSMVCLLYSVLGSSNAQLVNGDGLSSFTIPKFAMSVRFQRAPYLVDIETAMVDGSKREVLNLDSVENNAKLWTQADILVFHSGHWWIHSGNHRGWDFIQQGGSFYKDMERMLAYHKALTTWANWIDNNVNTLVTKVFFSSYSATHASGEEGKSNCYGATKPTSGSLNSRQFPKVFQVAEAVVKSMRSSVEFINVTLMSLLRKDAHPSVYEEGLSEGQKENPEKYSDCSHWCLPGVPDIWNEFLYHFV